MQADTAKLLVTLASLGVVALAVIATTIAGVWAPYIQPLRTLPDYAARVCNADLSCAPYERLMYIDGCATCVYTPLTDAVGGQNSLTDFVPAAFRFENALSTRNIFETGWTGSTFSGVSTTFMTGLSGFTIVDGYYRKTFYSAANNTLTGIGSGTHDLTRTEIIMRGTATITNSTEAPIVVILDMTTSGLFTTLPTFTYGMGTFGWLGGFAPVGTVVGNYNPLPNYPAFIINNKPTQPVGGAGVWAMSITLYQINYAI